MFLPSISGMLKVQEFLMSLYNFASQNNWTENLFLSLGTLVQPNLLMTSSPGECISFFLLPPTSPPLPQCFSPFRTAFLCSKSRAVQKSAHHICFSLGPGCSFGLWFYHLRFGLGHQKICHPESSHMLSVYLGITALSSWSLNHRLVRGTESRLHYYSPWEFVRGGVYQY